MIGVRHLVSSAAAITAAFLFSGCETSRRVNQAPVPPQQNRQILDTAPAVSPPLVAVVGWIEWISQDGRLAVIELARPEDPQAGLVWWTRDSQLAPSAQLAIQPPRKGRRLGAQVMQGAARVGQEVIGSDARLAPKIPPLQSGASK